MQRAKKKPTVPPMPKTAILDGDILVHQTAWRCDVEGIDDIPIQLDHEIGTSWHAEGIETTVIALSCKRDQNFRRKVYPPYKAHRDTGRASPECLPLCIEYVKENFETIERDFLEADDIMGVYCSRGEALAVTIDKDLRSIPGWHWNPEKEIKPVYVTEFEADLFFHMQWLIGDTTDNIPGLWKCGKAGAAKMLKDCKTAKEMTEVVLKAYKDGKDKEGNKYKMKDILAMARCVRILRGGDLQKNGSPRLWTP